MKKIMVLTFALLFAFTLVSCDKSTTTTESNRTTVSNDSSTALTTTFNPTTPTEALSTVKELGRTDITLDFWHSFDSDQLDSLDERIAAFEMIFPFITIHTTQKSDEDTLSRDITNSVLGGSTPDIITGETYSIAKYNYSNLLVNLDDFLNSNDSYKIIDSDSPNYNQEIAISYDMSHVIPGIANSNNIDNLGYKAIPMYFQTEVMLANVDILLAHLSELRTAGIVISDNGYISKDTPLTYTQLSAIKSILVDVNGADTTNMLSEYLMNYDFVSSLFLNASKQLGLNLLDSTKSLVIHEDETIIMLEYFDTLFSSNTLVLPTAWDQDYGSSNFKNGDVAFTVSRAEELRYNIPTTFNVDVLAIPQFATTPLEVITLGSNSFTSNQSNPFISNSLAIIDNDDEDKTLMSYLFIKFLMEADFLAELSLLGTAYPALITAYSSETSIDLGSTAAMSYKAFLDIAKGYWENDASVNWDTSDYKWDYLYQSMSANIAYSQLDNYFKYPIITTGVGLQGYGVLLDDLEDCLNNIYNDVFTPLQALEEVMD